MSRGYLLDTHVWLWMNGAPERLGNRTREVLTDPGNDLFFSAASAWEIGIKHALGKLTLPDAPERYVPRRLTDNAIQVLAVSLTHGLAVASLPAHHRDPFDRLLVAQCHVEGLTLITADPLLAPYGPAMLPARE